MRDLEKFLHRARRRRWFQGTLRRAVSVSLIGSAFGLALGMVGLVWPNEWTSLAAVAAACCGLAVGVATGLLRRPTLMATAVATDRAANLKDRVHTALQLTSAGSLDPYSRLQLRDATRALGNQAVSQLFPWRWPAHGWWATAATASAIVVAMISPRPEAVAAPVIPTAVVLEAEELKADFEKLERVSEDLVSEELSQLARTLREMLNHMQHRSHTAEDAMLELARMSEATEQAIAPFDSLVLEQALHELGEGLGALAGFEGAGHMLANGKYANAEQSLVQMAARIGAGRQPMLAAGGLLESRLGQMAGQADQAGLSELSEALSALRDAIRHGSRSECQAALSRLGGVMGKYGRRVAVARAMRNQLMRLSLAKNRMSPKGGYCRNCLNGGACSGGGCKGRGAGLGLPKMKYAQSDSPSQSAGTAAAMNLYGEQTELAGNRSAESVDGTWGSGDSEIETEVSLDGRQQAAAQYRKIYSKYRKLSDAVMVEEAVPLGHRETIRRYFERIHPDRVEAAGLTVDLGVDDDLDEQAVEDQGK